MNAPFIIAQATVGSAANSTQHVIKIAKPQGEQAISLRLDNTARLDLSDIGNEKVTFVHVGDRLVILFDNQATVTIAGFFDDNGKPFQNLNIEVEGGRVIVGSEFATLFPITDDASILPAAGNAGAPNSGASFHDATVEGFGTRSALGLLSGEGGNGAGNGNVENLTNTVPRIGAIALGNADDEGLSEGLIGGPGDVPGEAVSITISLNVDFGQDLTGRTLAFAATQPGLTGLTSGGQAISLALTVIAGLPALVGYTGVDPSDPTHHVFTITLDTTPLNGEYTFTLLQPLDHPIAGTEDTVTLSIDFIATDGNGDFANGTFQVAVNDDSPVAGPVTTGLTSEDGGMPASIVDASLEVSWGADRSNTGPGLPGDRSVGFTETDPALAGNNVAVNGTSSFAGPLTSNGELVRYTFIGDVLVGYVGLSVPLLIGDTSIVFTVTLSDAGALDKGTYTFDLRQPLDHPAPDGTQHYLDLTFTFTAVDSDGDSIDGSFKVEIDANGVILDAGATIDYSALTEGVFINLANSPQIGPGVFPGIQLVDANTATDHDGATVKVVGIDRLGDDIVNATGGSGDDVIIGGQEANILRGQQGDDTMRGMGGDDTLEGGQGDDFLRGDGGDDTLRGGDDNDQLVGNGGDDKLYGDAGHDLLDGGRGNDELHGGQGDDDLYGGRGNDKLYGGRGSDILYGGRGDDILDGGRGHDFLDGGRGDDILFGGRGDDLLFGGRGDDDLFGGDGDDRLAGEEGNDNLFGGADRDQLAYVFDLGVFSWDYDVFVGGETGDDYDTAILDGSFYWNDHLTITLTGFESFTADYTDIAGIEVTASEIERIWVLDDPLGGNNDHLLIEGSGGADHIIVTSNFLQEGLAGETVIASIGYEEVRIEGKGGADIIDASDYFYGGVVLRGNGGDDQIVGSDQADDIRGGAGDDTIDGGDGADLFTYDVGDGQDTVRGGGGNDLQEIYGSATSETFNVNAITLGGQQFVGINILDGIAVAQDVDATSANYEVATRDVEDIYIQTGAGADKVIVSGSLGGTGLATSTITIEDGNGNSGDTVDARGLTSNHSIEFIGHDGDDTLFVSGAGGNDTFIGGNGTDTINFRGVGHGVSVDLGNTQAQDTGDGRDTIDGVENAVGSNFNDTLAGDDDANVLTGLDGNDTIRGGLGNDTVEGGTGDDTFNYAIGDGVDTIEGGEGNEILGDKLVLTGTDGDQSITLKATAVGFNVDAGGAAGDEIVTTNVERAVLNLGAANDSLTVVGLNSGETITLVGNTISGTNLPTTTVTGAESVTIKGEGGNDTIDASRFGVAPTAGPGLAGSSAFGAFGNGWARFAAQTFVATGEALSELTFGLNNLTGQVDFRVVIVAWDEANHKPLSTTPLYESGTLLYTTGGATNFTVAPGVTLTPGQTYAFVLDFKTDGETLQGNAYIPTYSDANGTQPGGLYYSTSGGGREDALSNVWVASAAGNTDFAYQLTYAGHTVAGLTLDGGAGNDTIMGSAGNDTIYGGADNDTITGGKGNDTIDGGTGDDTSNYAIGDGVDTIEGGQGTDTLVVAGDANAQSLTLTATTSGFTLDTDGVAGAEITASNVEIATLNMAGGTDALTVAGLDTGETITLSGTAASFTVTGTNFPNTTVTNDEAITVNGNGGNDIIDASGLNPFVPVTAGTALGPQPNRLAAFGEGPGTIPYIAQTFVAKSAVLDQLSFTLGNSFGPDAVDFHVLIVAWDTVNNHPVAGAPLYESTTLSAAVSMGAQTFNFTVAPHLALTPAKTYAFVVDAFVARDAINGFAEVPLVTGALAAEQGGLFLISGDLATRDANFAVGWTGNSTVYDLAYQLSYQGVQTLGVTLNGGAGDDTITGSTGNDTISGGADNDIINYVVGTGHDVVDGGTGNDKLNVTGANDAETYNVNAMTLNSQTYLGINILAGANNNVQATALNYEVATKAVEDIFITTNGGGDTVNVTGSLNGTGLAQSTIHIDTGAGNDLIDISTRTSGHRVVADGGADTDTVKLGFAYGALPSSAYEKIFDGTTLVGVKITHLVGGVTVTDEFRNVENFEFTGGTKALANLFNVPPVINGANLTIMEGNTVYSFMAGLSISITDPDSSNFTYTVSEVTHGYFNHFNPDSWTDDYTTTFTSAEWALGDVGFVHDGSEYAPTFKITASDGGASSATVAGTVTFTNVNDGPVVNSATLTIAEGGTVAFAAGNLSVTDDGPTSNFAYTVSGVTNGTFQVSDGVTWTDDDSFTTADITANHVRFVHNGGEGAPAFSISASDGEASGAAKAGAVSFSNVNDAPFISAPAVQTVNKNTDLVFDAAHSNRITVGDPDSGDFNTVDILIRWTHGSIHTGGNGDWYHEGAYEYIGMRIGANLLLLNGFQFRPDANYVGDATLTFKVDDLGNTGTGGPLSISHTVTIHVTAPVALASAEGDLDAFATDSFYLDPLTGGVDDDVLHSGSESETLTGGAGNDTLTGGGGADTFKFAESGPANSDVITDYSAGEGDKLDLSSLLDAAFGTGSNTVADFVKLTYDGTNTKVEVDTDGAQNGHNWSEVATLNNYNSINNQVLVEFENAVHALNAA